MNYTEKIPVSKGWSEDKKYRITGEDGCFYLYRVSDITQANQKRMEFEKMQEISKMGIPMCHPVEFGVNEEGVYSIQTWIDGVDAEEVIGRYSPNRQYAYGVDAGQHLRKIHTIPAPPDQECWDSRFNRKIDRKIQKYTECPLKYDNDAAFLRCIEENRHLLKNCPQTFQHGDYHIGNMMIDRCGILTVIDFNRWDYGDPWEEFNRIVWCAQKSPEFASGMVDGYFNGSIPDEFWRLLALYISSNTLSSLYWAIPFGQSEINTMMNQAKEVLEWYNNMSTHIPNWYLPQ